MLEKMTGRVLPLLGRDKLGWALVILGLWALPVQAQIYKWVDRNGVTHYSNIPPPTTGHARKMEEYQHDAKAHALRIKATEEAQESEIKEFYDQQEAARLALEAKKKQAAELDAADAELQRKIKFEQKRLEGLIHKDRSEEWNSHIQSQLDLLESDPETYFEFHMDQVGRPPTRLPDTAPLEDGEEDSESREAFIPGPHLTDPHTGEIFPEAGGLGSRGTNFIKSGNGYLNTKTGRYFELE